MMHSQSRSCVRPITSTQDLTYQDPGRASASSDAWKEDVSMAVQETWEGGVVEAVHRTWTRIREYRHDLISLDEEDHSLLSEQLSITSEMQRLGKAEQSLHWQLQQADSLLVNRLREGVDVKAAIIRLMEDLQKTSELYDGEDASLMSQQLSIQSEMQRLRGLENDLHLQLEQAHLGGEIQDISPTRWCVDDGWSSGASIPSDSDGSDDATSLSPSTRSDTSILSDRIWELIWDAGLPTAAVRIPWLADDNSSNLVSVPPGSIKQGIFSSPTKGSSPVPSLYHESPETIDTSSTTSSFSPIPVHLPPPLYSLHPISVDLGDSLSAPTVCSDSESEFEEWMRIRGLRDSEEDISMFSQQELSLGSEIQRPDDFDKSDNSSQFQEADFGGKFQQVLTTIRDGRPSLQCSFEDSAHSSDSEHTLSRDCEPLGAIWQQDIDTMERGLLWQNENSRPCSFPTTRPRKLDLNVANKYDVFPLASHGVSPTIEATAEIEKGISSSVLICSSSSSQVPCMYHDSPETMDTTGVSVIERTGVLPSPIHLSFSNHKMPLQTARIASQVALGDDDASVDDSVSALSPGTGCSIVESSSKVGSLLNTVADVLFGDAEYLVPTFSSHRPLYRRNFANKYHVFPLASHGVSPTIEPAAEIEKGISSPVMTFSSSSSQVPCLYHESPETMDVTGVSVIERTGVLPSPIHLSFSNHKMQLQTARIAPQETLGDDDASVDDSVSALSPGTGCSIVESSSKVGSLLNTVANILFGDAEYLVPTFSSHRPLYRRNFANKYHVYPLASHGVSPTTSMETTTEVEKGTSSPVMTFSSSSSQVPCLYHESPETMDTTGVTVTEHTGVPPSPILLSFSTHKMPLQTVRIAPHETLCDDDASVDDSVSALSPCTGCSIVESSSKVGSLLNTVANVLFGDTKYLTPTFSIHHDQLQVLYRRSYQGGASFGMATALICMQLHIHFAFLLPLPAVAILPMVAAWVEVHTPHDVDEATLAVFATILSLSIKLFTTCYSSSSSIRETNILIAFI